MGTFHDNNDVYDDDDDEDNHDNDDDYNNNDEKVGFKELLLWHRALSAPGYAS